MRGLIALLGLIGLLATPALADVTVRYKVKDQANRALIVSVADNGNARFDSGDGAVLIVRDRVGYFVASDREGQFVGRVEDGITVMTEFMTALVQMMEAAASQAPPAEGQAQGAGPQGGVAELRAMARAPFTVQERGRETVGGRTGTLYLIAPAEAGAQGPSLEVVIAGDADLAPVGGEIRRLLSLAVQPASTLLGESPDILSKLDGVLARGFPIRIGRHFTLDSVSAEPLPASSFELPGPVLGLEELRARSPLTALAAARASEQPAEAAPEADAEPDPDPSDE